MFGFCVIIYLASVRRDCSLGRLLYSLSVVESPFWLFFSFFSCPSGKFLRHIDVTEFIIHEYQHSFEQRSSAWINGERVRESHWGFGWPPALYFAGRFIVSGFTTLGIILGLFDLFSQMGKAEALEKSQC